MRLKHEDLIYWLIVSAATFVALLITIAIFSTESWAIGGQLTMFALVVIVWAGCMIGATGGFLSGRDERVKTEEEAWENREKRRLERAQLEAAIDHKQEAEKTDA